MANGEIGTVGEQVRVGRARKRITLRALATKMGKTPSYLSDIENERRIPSETVMADLARELDLNFDELMTAAGKFGGDADRYMRKTPEAGVLFRRMSDRNVSPEVIRRLIRDTPELQDDQSK
jgi:transcriptional regulator with XRE-family HTH domain